MNQFKFDKQDEREIEALAKIDIQAALRAAMTLSRRYVQDEEGNWVKYDQLERSSKEEAKPSGTEDAGK